MGWKFLAMGMICKGTWELSDLGAYSWQMDEGKKVAVLKHFGKELLKLSSIG